MEYSGIAALAGALKENIGKVIVGKERQIELILAAMFLTPGLAADDIVCFGDVRPGQWYYSAIRSVYEQGLMEGYSGTAFRPSSGSRRSSRF